MSEKKIVIDRKKNGDLSVKYDGKAIENVNALSISVSPMGVAATLVFICDAAEVRSTLHRIVGCRESDENFEEMEIN